MNLVKTSLLSAIAVFVKTLTLLGINKVLAVYVGPSGYAMIGQFQNAVQMMTTLATGAVNTGVTKYTAEYDGDETKQIDVWRTAGTVSVICSIILGFFLISFRNFLSNWLLKTQDYSTVFLWFGFGLVTLALNSLLLSILNGKKEVKKYVSANIAGSILALLITAGMTESFGLIGALTSLVVYQSLGFFVTCYFCYKAKWFSFSYLFGGIQKETIGKLSRYTLMAITSAICVPITHMYIRNIVGETVDWESAGYWEAMYRLSGAYLMLITMTLSVYYLPRLSELKGLLEIKKEILTGYRIILPLTFLFCCGVYIFRDLIISILFTEEFLPVRDLFVWQLVGDFFKIGSWIVSYIMIGQAMTKLYVVTEVLFSASLVLFSHWFVLFWGVEGVVAAYALNYLLYWFVIGLLVTKKLRAQRGWGRAL